jgi:hypothetical protein
MNTLFPSTESSVSTPAKTISANPVSAPQRSANAQISYEPVTAKPQIPWRERINMRVIIFAAVIAMMVGYPAYIYFASMVTGGVYNHGTYKEVDLKAMSNFDFNQTQGRMIDIPVKFRELDGQKVLLKGEMVASATAEDASLGYFQLCYSIAQCCFSGPRLVQHFVDCTVPAGKTAYFYGGQVQVTGTLHVKIVKDPDVGTIKSVYQLDISRVAPVQ